MGIEFLDCLKRRRDIRIKPKFSGGKTGFRCTPALIALEICQMHAESAFAKGQNRQKIWFSLCKDFLPFKGPELVLLYISLIKVLNLAENSMK